MRRARSRAGFTLVEAMLATLLMCVLGGAALRAIGTVGRDAARLRARTWLAEIGDDLVDSLAAGGARELLTRAPERPWTYAKELAPHEIQQWLSTRGDTVRAEILELSPRIEIVLEVAPPPPGEHRVRFARIACTIAWVDPVAGAQRTTIRTLTDSL